jgi:uncharacterized protein YjiK
MKFISLFLVSVSLALGVFLFTGDQTEWIMPKELNEISGISFIDDNMLACVQDETGIIFLYNLKEAEIIERIPFAGKGDYEGIAIHEKNAYVITGDGILYEITDFLSDRKVRSWNLNLPKNEESEALYYDERTDRLLLAFKNHKKDDINPGLFTFNISSGSFVDSAVVQVNFRSDEIRKKDRFDYKKLWQPADLAVDKQSGAIYVLDAINGHLMKFSGEGELKKLIRLDHKENHHPEGIAINSKGELFICNDGNNDSKGKIVKLPD